MAGDSTAAMTLRGEDYLFADVVPLTQETQESDHQVVARSAHCRSFRFAALAAVALALVGIATIQEGCGESEEKEKGGLVEATKEGSCKIPAKWCAENPNREDELSYRDCDGDGILDPYCQGGQLLRFGYLSSKNGCKDNWPSGLCTRVEEPKQDQGEFSNKVAAPNEITIIHFNDVYQVAGVLAGGVRRGGMSRAAYAINLERKRNPDRTFVVFAGDALSPSVLSDLFDGAQMVDILNYLKLDAASLGNHEFDFGVETLATRIGESNFPWLNINLMDEKGKLLNGTTKRLIRDVPFMAPWSTEEKKARVCLFGSAYDVRETMFKDKERITYADKINAAEEEATYLRDKENCSVVLAMTHQFSKSDCEMSKRLGNKIDLILGAHDHSTEMTTVCGHAPYVKADSDLKTQWIMTIWLDENGKVESTDGRLLSFTDVDPFDMEVHDKIVQWEEKGEKEMGKVMGCTDVDIDTIDAHSRQQETNGGVFFTDAVRKFHKTDVCLINGGTIRGNKIFDKGNLTKGRITEMHPFGNSIVKIYITGKQLHDYIETTLKCWNSKCGAFPQASGIKYTFDPDKPDGHRLISLTCEDGKDIQPTDSMTLALTDYMLSSSALKNNKLFDMTTLNDAVPIVVALFDAAKQTYDDGKKCVSPKKDGRIKNVS